MIHVQSLRETLQHLFAFDVGIEVLVQENSIAPLFRIEYRDTIFDIEMSSWCFPNQQTAISSLLQIREQLHFWFGFERQPVWC